MPVSLHLHIVDDPRGGWRLSAADGHTRPVEVWIPAEVVADVTGRARPAPTAPGVILPGDTRWARAEEAAGGVLAGMIAEVASRVAWFLGDASARGERPVIVVDAEPVGARELPWELLAMDAASPPMETLGRAIVARRGPGTVAPARRDGRRLEVLVWCPTPDDDVCRGVAAALDAVLAAHGVAPAHRIDPSEAAPHADPDVARVLHVICHGRLDEGRVELLLGEGERGAATTGHLLADWLRTTDLVVLDVCAAASATRVELDSLAPRLIAAGAGVCVAPALRADVRAIKAFADGLYGMLTSGRVLADAIAGGRRAIRALAIGHPNGRWANHLFHVADATAATTGPLVSQAWRPEGWPPPSADASAYLAAVHAFAGRLSTGFVGLDHLARVLYAGAWGGRALSPIRLALAERCEAPARTPKGMYLIEGRESDVRGTPRLRGYASRLRPGFAVQDLWRLIAEDPNHDLAGLLGVPRAAPGVEAGATVSPAIELGETIDVQTRADLPEPAPREQSVPASRLEVLGGPEDGLALVPRVGDRVGRWSGDPEVALPLYASTALVDRVMKRRHLQWMGPGRVVLEGQVSIVRGREVIAAGPGEAEICVGDVVHLTEATRLRALA